MHTHVKHGCCESVSASRTLRSYVRCDLCCHRANGETTKGYTYYRCSPNAKNHGHLPWFSGHPRAAMVAEEQLTEPLARFFAERIFGLGRRHYLAAVTADAQQTTRSAAATRRAELTAAVGELARRQENLIKELERLEPTGDPDVDDAWRRGAAPGQPEPAAGLVRPAPVCIRGELLHLGHRVVVPTIRRMPKRGNFFHVDGPRVRAVSRSWIGLMATP